jgi:hypothetical protein
LANKETVLLPRNAATIIDPPNDHVLIDQFLDSTGVSAAGVVVKLPWATQAQSFMRALKIELMAPKIEGLLADIFA